jgi:hypothetical protein
MKINRMQLYWVVANAFVLGFAIGMAAGVMTLLYLQGLL